MALSRRLHNQVVVDVPWYEQVDPSRRIIRGKAYFRLKRVMDLTICVLLLPCLVVAFVICAILIKIDSPNGPILFQQQRTGRGGRRFGMYKFRTMVPNAEELKKELMHLNELQWPDFKITNDPRITRVGRFLRKTSLDELPQIINVLKGEMSLVGPRPTSFASSTYLLWHTERLDTIPGITGLWQIVGRAETEFDDRLRLDIAYIERQSIWFDINILARTVLAVTEARGAH
jgi:lipopolysaccharide/colanic/teichoic acid biosynthesis glycosyltransferase